MVFPGVMESRETSEGCDCGGDVGLEADPFGDVTAL
jgi:hypothetical protein